MRKILKFSVLLLAVGLVLGLAGCKTDPDDSGNGDGGGDGIKWDNEPSGTLTILNNTTKDMVLFQGQTPTIGNTLGGVRAGTQKTFDISDDVDDFQIGGYMVLRAMTLTEYNSNKSNLSNAKIEFSAMATYRATQKFRAEINPAYVGDYYYKATNAGAIGIELRKDSPDGEKIGYLPALATNYALYFSSTNSMTVFPVYVFYSRITQTVTTIKPTDFGSSVSVGPRPVTDSSVATVRFPNDPSIQWSQIVANITYPVAFIRVTNNVANQDTRLASASKVYFAQNGYDSVNSGEINTFEITATDSGQSMNLNMTLYGGTVTIPVKQDGNTPVIKNGYDYNLTLGYDGSGWNNVSAYTATITEGSKRDVTSEISSL